MLQQCCQYYPMKSKTISLLFLLLISCLSSHHTNPKVVDDSQKIKSDTAISTSEQKKSEQLQEYNNHFSGFNADEQLMLVLRRVFQDSHQNIWFVGDGVFCYTGKTLIDFSNHPIFNKTVVRQITEDQKGNIWFGTSGGIIKYQPEEDIHPDTGTFTKLSKQQGLIDNDVWSMAIDHKEIIWIGTLEGVSRFDGQEFTTFQIPEAIPDKTRGVTSAKIVHDITEDRKGNIWFGTNGGAYFYDGKTLHHISEKDGLCNNTINDILEDRQGNIWFASHHNGVCFWDGNSITHITEELESQDLEVWSLYEDKSGAVWFPVENKGVYRYKGTSLTNFHQKEGLSINGVHSILEDKKGNLWFGGFNGLYRYDGKRFVAMTRYTSW